MANIDFDDLVLKRSSKNLVVIKRLEAMELSFTSSCFIILSKHLPNNILLTSFYQKLFLIKAELSGISMIFKIKHD